ncbi:ISKra4 family transposase [Nocardia sp. NPDC059239]|uniref:ISKra4 family transposase n=1 Tax=Nocardia sp. NPDC059239 TaxID=3346785 RepID=UPI0036BB75A2
MTRYDIPASAGPFAASRQSFDALVADLESTRTARFSHDELEDLIAGRGRELLRQLLQDHLDLRADREETALTAARDGGRLPAGRHRLERGHSRALATVVGTVQVRRCAVRALGQPNIYPADAALSLPVGRHSHGLRKQAVLEAVRSSYDTTHSAISSRCGPVAGKRQLEDLVAAAAVDIDDFYTTRTPQPATRETLLVLTADAKGIVMRPDSLREPTRRAAARATPVFRTRLASGEKPHRKRMATLAAVYDTAPAPRRPHDVITVPGGPRSPGRPPRPGPHAVNIRRTTSLVKDPTEVIAAAFAEADARDPTHERTWIVLVDGDPRQIDRIRAEAARHRVNIHIVLDLIHVIEYAWTAAWCFYSPGEPAAEDWVAARILQILTGHADQAADAIAARADAAGLAPERRGGADAAIRYLRRHLEYLRYDTALEHGWPISTGLIEGAARHLVADRLDITGSRWGLTGAEAVLTLRTLISNGDFDSYWNFHLTREHQRVHPTNYQLAA